MWILIDNNDSFTYILADYLKQLNPIVKVIHMDDNISLESIIAFNPSRIIISPGPGKPEEAILSRKVLEYFYDKIPILGICLGHQLIAQFFGGLCNPSGNPLHGKTSNLNIIHPHALFDNIKKEELQIMHYHSLVVSQLDNTPIQVLALDDRNQIMAIEHKTFPIIGLQFHPESILTTKGLQMLTNWKHLYKQ